MANFCDMYNKSFQHKCILKGKCLDLKCNEFCLKCYKFYYYLNESRLPMQYVLQPLKLVDNDIDAPYHNKLVKIKNNMEKFTQMGANLLIHGKTPGSGKTFWAVKLAQNYLLGLLDRDVESIPPALFITESTLISYFEKYRFDNTQDSINLLYNMMNCNLLILDDIGMFNKTDYQMQQLFILIDYRVMNKKSTIYTSNLSLGREFSDTFGLRLASRILDTAGTAEFQSASRRTV